MIKRSGHTSFESIIVAFVISIAIIVVAPIVVGYIQDAKVTKVITEIREEEKVINETMVSIYSSYFVSGKAKENKLTGEYIVKKIKRNSNSGLQIYVYGEESPLYTEEDADMVIYLTMEADNGVVVNPVNDNDISESELLSITPYRIVGRYGVYLYNGELYE